MKKIICILLAFLPLFASAKDDKKKEDNYNPKYLTNALTYQDNKIVFEQTVNVPTLSEDVIYEKLLAWANERFNEQDGMKNHRVVYTNKEKGQIAAAGEEYLVFTSTALSLDRTRIYYQFSMFVNPGKFQLRMERIRYWYDENRDGGERYTAEEWINDDMALTKKNTKLAPITGKFRRETIDLKDDLFKTATEAVTLKDVSTEPVLADNTNQQQVATVPNTIVTQNNVAQSNAAVQTNVATQTNATAAVSATTQTNAAATTVAATTIPAATLQPAVTQKELKEISLNQLPTNLNEIAATGRISITVGEEEVDVKAEAWGGFGKLLNKDVAYTLIDKSRMAVSLLMEHSDIYKVSFYQPGNTQPTVVIECKKSMKQELTAEELKSLNQQIDTNKHYTMYIGAITRCMMR